MTAVVRKIVLRRIGSRRARARGAALRSSPAFVAICPDLHAEATGLVASRWHGEPRFVGEDRMPYFNALIDSVIHNRTQHRPAVLA